MKHLPEWVIPSAQALLALDASDSLVPHGIGGHARSIIQEFINAFDTPLPRSLEDERELQSAKDHLKWLKDTAVDKQDLARVVGYEDCLREWSASLTSQDETVARLRADNKRLRSVIQALFCDPEGNPCFQGSDGDREVLREALSASESGDV